MPSLIKDIIAKRLYFWRVRPGGERASWAFFSWISRDLETNKEEFCSESEIPEQR